VPSETKPVLERIEAAAREIGVLLIAFAPLDAAVNAAQGQKVGSLLYFALLGLCLFTVAMLMEWYRKRGNQK
jgi:hypothetical protein